MSTALMYSFAQRTDCYVIDEPFYSHYLTNSTAKLLHPGADEIIKSQPSDARTVIDNLLTTQKNELLFIKNMSHHILDINLSFLSHFHNIILTRHPKKMISSFSKVIVNPTMQDIGYDKQSELVTYLEEKKLRPIVIEASEFLLEPELKLKTLCSLLNIPFQPRMLTWQPGPIKEDGIWAKYWYKTVHESSGFSRETTTAVDLPLRLKPLLHEAMPYYQNLLRYKI